MLKLFHDKARWSFIIQLPLAILELYNLMYFDWKNEIKSPP